MNPYKKYGESIGDGIDAYAFRVNPTTVGMLMKKLPGKDYTHKTLWYDTMGWTMGYEEVDDSSLLFVHIPYMKAHGRKPYWIEYFRTGGMSDSSNMIGTTPNLINWDYYFGANATRMRSYRPHLFDIYMKGRVFLEGWSERDNINHLGWDMNYSNWRIYGGQWVLTDPFVYTRGNSFELFEAVKTLRKIL